MTPIINPDTCPDGSMLRVLNLLEAHCRIRGIAEVTEDDVRAFIRERSGQRVADRFSPSYLYQQ